ncbi:(2Fe-2S)-binding protein [Lottiidibacillus patelloidae]|uniref:(2Fe-2S)-binding protein n=1 Tax=Lottiidibacillus patelloidae TaxID=2670334 RepID=A0A263BUL4_9BACI|nr:2Fe-2S iron-sulfur cluster-binding protein [Lottiidibacillus patelloidae]OZM57433.1 (2Fe-2S)-binding protein [Lottiidibacillus patelloidae]
MPKITVPEHGTFEVENGKKLVLALEDNGVHILHRCGGKAKCTSCQVEIQSGSLPEPNEAEQAAIKAKGVEEGIRLSCQCFVTEDMTVNPLKTVESTGLDAGPRPEDE